MAWVKERGSLLWVGMHKNLGPLVAHSSQKKIIDSGIGRARFYVCQRKKIAEFEMAVVKQFLVNLGPTPTWVQDAVSIAFDGTVDFSKQDFRSTDEYEKLRNSYCADTRRLACCYRCRKLLDSSLDVIHKKCKWIQCDCGACGCGYFSG